LEEALGNINKAIEVNPDNSSAHAVRALVLDWSAGAATTEEERSDFLTEASQAAVRARQLDNQNALALAYMAEVYTDLFRWEDAVRHAELALERDPTLMDTHRVYAYVLESLGDYGSAIEEYKNAAEITPNLTILYISIGQNYRHLKLYDLALEYFALAATINEDKGNPDPLPYIAIAKTYVRLGEFFIAARNAQHAIDIAPTTPDFYGQLGDIYFRSRNYEGSIPVLRCAVKGCTASENELQGVNVEGLELSDESVVYYYTFGSVLAALELCEEASPLLDEIAASYAENDLVMGIVQESMFICEGY
jgi:tetratricopeptide (TPR) repeat protein